MKSLGDASTAIGRLPRGTRMIVEGPFGAFTPRAIEDRKVLFIVGGIGVAPVKAMLERLDSRHQPIVLYRASRHDDLVYAKELGVDESHPGPVGSRCAAVRSRTPAVGRSGGPARGRRRRDRHSFRATLVVMT